MKTLHFLPNQPKKQMAEFLVKDIINYNTIKTEGWVLGKGEDATKGENVVIRGIPILDPGDPFWRDRAKDRLKITLQDKKVELKDAIPTITGEILCDVSINGVNVKNYFSDFKK